MPVRTGRASNAGAARASSSVSPRQKALGTIMSALHKAKKAGDLPKARLELVDADLYRGRGGVRAVPVSLSHDDKQALSSWPSFDRVMVDEKNKKLYVEDRIEGTVGPLPLPRGVSLSALFDDGSPFPRAKDDYQRAIGKLARVVEKGLPEAYAEGHVKLDFKHGHWRAPNGEKLEHHYIDDHTGRMPGGALMIGRERFWVELIPGVSGDCIGPFALPRNFDVAALERPVVDDPAPVRDDGFHRGRGYAHVLGDSGTYGRTSRWISTSSGSWPVSPGGSGS